MPSKFQDKTYWLRGAEEVRRRARTLTAADEKRQMIEIAAVYERLADHYGASASASVPSSERERSGVAGS
jgi:hypothetical protein